MLVGYDPSCHTPRPESEVVWTVLLDLCVHFLALWVHPQLEALIP
ncbi:hypothetical protein X897_3305 [Burkholderia pseudomallei ABCPW 30]|nr:hypothetical protein X897_3305 [Burkholderia pseudomallei ABCPW 30]